MIFYKDSSRDSLEYRLDELLDAIRILRKKPELGDMCFRVYYPGEDISSCRVALEEEAKNYGYNIYFKSGKVGTTLGMLKDAALEYWE